MPKSMWTCWGWWLLSFVLLMAAAACTNSAPTADSQTAPEASNGAATGAWQPPAAAITLDNVPQIAQLGTLTVEGSSSTLFAFAFSPDSTRLAALNNDLLVMWDLQTGEMVFSTSRVDAVHVFFSTDGEEIYTLTAEGAVSIYEAANGNLVENMDIRREFNNVVAHNPATGRLALGGLDGSVVVWDGAQREGVATVEALSQAVTAVAFSPDGEVLAVTSGERMTVWDWQNAEALSAGNVPSGSNRLALSPDAAQIAVGAPGRLVLVALNSDLPTFNLDATEGGAEVVRFSPDGAFLLSGGPAPDARLWEPLAGRLIATLPDAGGTRFSAAFAPSGNLLASATIGGGVNLWNLTEITDETVSRASLDVGEAQVVLVGWSPDATTLVVFDTLGSVMVWGVPGGE